MLKKLSCVLGVSSLIVFGTVPAQAYEAGDIILRGGAARVVPNDNSGLLSANGTYLGGTGVGVGADTQLGITGTYMVTKNFGVELLASTPFSHDIEARGATLAGLGLHGEIGQVKHLPPTITAQYYFDTGSDLTPYVGAGLNYTWILDSSLSPHAKSVLGSDNITVDNSLGYALEGGIDYKLTRNLVLNAAIWYIDINTVANIYNTGLGHLRVDVAVDPFVYMLGMGYKF